MTVINTNNKNGSSSISNSVATSSLGRESDESSSNGVIVLNESYSIDVASNSVVVNIEDNERRSFSFDRMLSPFVSQREVFTEVHNIVDAVCMGFNGTIIAYGQTSAGKYVIGFTLITTNIFLSDFHFF